MNEGFTSDIFRRYVRAKALSAKLLRVFIPHHKWWG